MAECKLHYRGIVKGVMGILFIGLAVAVSALLYGCSTSTEVGDDTAGKDGSTSGLAASDADQELVASFVGNWKYAATMPTKGADADRICVEDGDNASYIVVDENGEGRLFNGDDSISFTWGVEDSAIVISSDVLYYADDLISYHDTDAITFFSKDGAFEGCPLIDPEKTTPIVSEKEMEGTWLTVGIGEEGGRISYVRPGAAQMIAVEECEIFSFKDNETLYYQGEESGTWTIDDEGAHMQMTVYGQQCTVPVTLFDDFLVVNYMSTEAHVFYVLERASDMEDAWAISEEGIPETLSGTDDSSAGDGDDSGPASDSESGRGGLTIEQINEDYVKQVVPLYLEFEFDNKAFEEARVTSCEINVSDPKQDGDDLTLKVSGDIVVEYPDGQVGSGNYVLSFLAADPNEGGNVWVPNGYSLDDSILPGSLEK